MTKIIRRRTEDSRNSVPPSVAKLGYMTEKLLPFIRQEGKWVDYLVAQTIRKEFVRRPAGLKIKALSGQLPSGRVLQSRFFEDRQNSTAQTLPLPDRTPPHRSRPPWLL